MITWPTRLQKYFDEQGFSYAAGEGALRTQMQVGLPESRPLVSDVVWTASGTIKIPFREFPVLTEFYENELKNGSLRFRKQDPVDETIMWMWRFTKPFIASGFGGGYLLIQMNLERIPATATTVAKPSISIYPSITVNEGEEVTINATVLHADHLQWQEHGVDIPGENGASLVLGYAHHSMDGHTYTLVGTNSNGVTTSNVATLHVLKIAPVFTHPFTVPIEMTVGSAVQGYSMAPHFETGGDVDSYVLHGFPAGITIDAQGVLHGTPTTIMDHHPATVEAVNSVGTASSNTVMVNVVAHVPAPRFDHTIADLIAIRGEAYTQDVSPRFLLGGHVDSYSLQNAPAGMVIDNAGEISWPNPVKTTSPAVTVTAHNLSGDAVSNAFGVEAAALGTELVPNGTFDTNLDGWINPDDHFVWDAGRARAASVGRFNLRISIEKGVRHRVKFDASDVSGSQGGVLVLNGGTNNVKYYISSHNGTIAGSAVYFGDGTFHGITALTSISQIIGVQVNTDLFAIDNFTLRELNPPPRIVNEPGNQFFEIGVPVNLDTSPWFNLNGLPATFSLQNAPNGMTISNVGMITWPNPVKGTTAGVTVTATNEFGSAVTKVFGVTVTDPTP